MTRSCITAPIGSSGMYGMSIGVGEVAAGSCAGGAVFGGSLVLPVASLKRLLWKPRPLSETI